MSQINQILERIAQIQKTIKVGTSKVLAAYPYEPADPSSGSCPFTVNEVRGGPTAFYASGVLQNIQTVVVMNFCIARKDSDVTLVSVQEHALAWRDEVILAFARKIKLSNTAGEIDLPFVLEAHITNWDLAPKAFGTSEFIAVVFDLMVSELFPATVLP